MTDRMTNAEIEALCEALENELLDRWPYPNVVSPELGRKALTAIRQLQTERDQSESAYSIAHDQATMNGQELNAIRQLQNPWMPLPPAPETGE